MVKLNLNAGDLIGAVKSSVCVDSGNLMTSNSSSFVSSIVSAAAAAASFSELAS